MALISIAVVDDHRLFREGLIRLIKSFGMDFKVTIEAQNGKDLINCLQVNPVPDVALVDIEMPQMNGFETIEFLKKEHPSVKVLVLTMVENDTTLIRMLRLGIKGFLSKDIDPVELKTAIISACNNEFYQTPNLTNQIITALNKSGEEAVSEISDQEKKFLELACTELTYKEIAHQMCLSVKTIDGYRANLFEKFGVKSRVGLVLFAFKNGLISSLGLSK